jgi:hypothetical protein
MRPIHRGGVNISYRVKEKYRDIKTGIMVKHSSPIIQGAKNT